MTPQQPEMNEFQRLRAICAEAFGVALVQATDDDTAGLTLEEITKRASLRLQLDAKLRHLFTIAINDIENYYRQALAAQLNALLRPGQKLITADGQQVHVEMSDSMLDAKLKVTNILNGAALKVSDGAFVVFVDSRAASSEALKRWEKLVNGDTRLMVIPLDVPRNQTVEQIVAAKRQDEGGFTK